MGYSPSEKACYCLPDVAMATVPKIPNDRPIPLQRRLLYQFLLERFQGDPKGAKFVCLEGSPEGVVAVQVCVRAIACRSSADSDTRTASLTRPHVGVRERT